MCKLEPAREQQVTAVRPSGKQAIDVAIDVSSLFRRYRKHTGIPRVVRHLLAALSVDSRVRLIRYVNCSDLGARLDRHKLRRALNVGEIAAVYDGGRCDGLNLVRLGPDVIHSTFYPPPRWLLEVTPQWVATIHDLRPLDDPNSVEERHIELFKRLGTLVKQQATVVHCVSRFTAGRVQEHWGVPAERICVIYPGTVTPSSAGPGLDNSGPVDGRYVLFIGTVQPAKQLDLAAEAFALLVADRRFRDLKLVVVGSAWRAEPTSHTWRRLVTRGKILRFTRVDDEKRDALLRGAVAVLCTSRYEGFGLVPVEAVMASVIPVVSMAHPCLEILAGWPYKFHTGSTLDCAGVLREALAEPQARWQALAKAREQLACWTWRDASSAFITLYRGATM